MLWLFVCCGRGVWGSPRVAVVRAGSGQSHRGNGEGRHWRLFLLQEPDFEGLGLERARPVAPPLAAPSAACMATSVSYWLWAGEGQDALYCQCTDPATGAAVPDTPPACQTP